MRAAGPQDRLGLEVGESGPRLRSLPILHPGRSQNTCLARLMDGPGMALFASRVRHSSCLTALQVTLVSTFKAGSTEEWSDHLTRPQRNVLPASHRHSDCTHTGEGEEGTGGRRWQRTCSWAVLAWPSFPRGHWTPRPLGTEPGDKTTSNPRPVPCAATAPPLLVQL